MFYAGFLASISSLQSQFDRLALGCLIYFGLLAKTEFSC